MEFKLYPYKLRFRFPFRIAHTVRDFTPNAYLKIRALGVEAWGEAVFPPYYTETAKTFEDFLKLVALPTDIINTHIGRYIQNIDHLIPNNHFAKAAIDIALHNLKAKITRISIAKQYNIPYVRKNSSFTIGITNKEDMEQQLTFADQFEYIKLKIDEENIDQIIENYISLSSKPFVVDANQGFKNKEVALKWCQQLHKYGVAYMEQPFDKDNLLDHAWLKSKSPLPIIADESFQRFSDFDKVSRCFDGINVKLMKCIGIAESHKCLKEAKRRNLKTVIGCMSGSSVAVNAAWHLAPLADWVDLDGPDLIVNDWFR